MVAGIIFLLLALPLHANGQDIAIHAHADVAAVHSCQGMKPKVPSLNCTRGTSRSRRHQRNVPIGATVLGLPGTSAMTSNLSLSCNP